MSRARWWEDNIAWRLSWWPRRLACAVLGHRPAVDLNAPWRLLLGRHVPVDMACPRCFHPGEI